MEQDTVVEMKTASEPFLGKWRNLVSTTNWDKGRIIAQWREALIESDAPATEYSDETWAQLVGGVTGQHSGRLRRVYERFNETYANFKGLYWSHFQAALDWDDAEMWLEGATQNKWSVAIMRRNRWQTMGAVADEEPKDSDIVASETDEDFVEPKSEDLEMSEDYAQGVAPEGPDFGDEDDEDVRSHSRETGEDDTQTEDVDLVRPFEKIKELPEDLREAMEALKVVIIRHKVDEWNEVSDEVVLACLDGLKTLVNAPSAD